MPQDYSVEENELTLYIDNESSLYAQKKSIIANLKARIEKGTYDAERAVKLWAYWVEAGARRYCKEFGCTLQNTFPKSARLNVAREISKREYQSIVAGEYGPLTTRTTTTKRSTTKKPSMAQIKEVSKYHTAYKGPTNTTGSRIIVTNLSTGKRKTVSYDYAAHDAHQSAIHSAFGVDASKLLQKDDGHSGFYWA